MVGPQGTRFWATEAIFEFRLGSRDIGTFRCFWGVKSGFGNWRFLAHMNVTVNIGNKASLVIWHKINSFEMRYWGFHCTIFLCLRTFRTTGGIANPSLCMIAKLVKIILSCDHATTQVMGQWGHQLFWKPVSNPTFRNAWCGCPKFSSLFVTFVVFTDFFFPIVKVKHFLALW